MVDAELTLTKAILFNETRIALVHGVRLGYKALVRTARTNALFIEECQQTHFAFDKVEDIRVVVIANLFQFDSFGFVLLLDRTKDILRELLLQLLVRIVNAELLKAIDHKGFKAKDIEQPNDTEPRLLDTVVVAFGTRCIVDGSHQPKKGLGVYFLGKGVTRVLRGCCIQGNLELFVARSHGSDRQGRKEIFGYNAHERGECLEFFLRRNDGSLPIRRIGFENQVTELQHDTDGPHQRLELVTFHPYQS